MALPTYQVIWSYPWKLGVESKEEEVLLDVGNVREVGVRIGGVMAEGAMITKLNQEFESFNEFERLTICLLDKNLCPLIDGY